MVLSRLMNDQNVSETTINTWFDEVQAVSMKDKVFCLHCPNDFKRSTIESMFIDRIKLALRDIYSVDFDVRFLSDAEVSRLGSEQTREHLSLMESGNFTFDTFVVGESNKMAYAAARAVADGAIDHYNPLFIYGESGLGKTHLIYAIAHEVRARNPKANIVYVKGDDFINDFIEHLRAGRGSEFRAKYRDAQLFLVDDVQFVAGKDQVQNEFFHTFNTIYEAGHQIVLTSDRLPSEMPLLDDRLRTRFEWGLTTDVKRPDFETRVAIVKNKAVQWGAVINDDLAKFIAQKVTTNVRQLEGTMNKILALRELMSKDMDEEAINLTIKKTLQDSIEYVPTADDIIAEVSRYYGIASDVITGSSQNKTAVAARQMAMCLIRRLTSLSTPEIGRIFGRDHSTVIYSIKQIEKKIPSDPSLSGTVRDITINVQARR